MAFAGGRATLAYAVIGALLLNVVLFTLLPELVRDPDMQRTRGHSEPVQVYMPPEKVPRATHREREHRTAETRKREQVELQPLPRPDLSLKADLEPLLPEFESTISLPEPEFDLAGVGVMQKVEAQVDIGSPSGVYPNDELDEPVRPVTQTPFLYPLRAKRQGVEGWVKVALQVGLNGEVEEVEVLESEPEGIFEGSVTRGIRSWRFSPATLMGERVRARVVTTIRFELED
ncbi:MAG: TonB family protein [Desulfuromonadaceae bacterium]